MFIEIPPSTQTTKGFHVFAQQILLSPAQAQELGVVSLGNADVALNIFHIDYPSQNSIHNSHWEKLFRGEPSLDNFLQNIRKTFFPEKKGSPIHFFIQQNLYKPNIGILIGHGEVYGEIDERLVGGLGSNAASFDYEHYLINSITDKYPNLTSLIVAICSPDNNIDTRDYTNIQNVLYPIFFARNSVPFFGHTFNPNGSVVVLKNGKTTEYYFDKYGDM